MAKQVYWLSDVEWRRIEPLLPRGRKGAHRVDDRRVISGIIHMLKSGSRWRDCPEVYGPYTTVYNRFNRWSRQGIWTGIFYALTGSTGMYGSISVASTYIKAHRSAAGAKGAFNNAIGRSRGGQTTKIHALTDDIGRPLAFLITPGNTHDLVGARDLIGRIRNPRRLLADRAYDAKSLRDELAARRIKAVIPPNPTRKHPHRYDKAAYKGRNVIERMFCRLKDFRRIATRYDKRADIFLSAILLAAAISWWAN
ncbi:IS5 family transposase [Bradyrhizobium sp. 149]|uniref:IS5 family transposase n=1 Tax=Bradyrhizobium sp. 149 TaxID=2782624 RepID=UPI001FF72318|nr:IS5 family transposase [Bradyrhizobium sp. 149]